MTSAADRERNRAVWATVNERFTDADADDRWTGDGLRWGLFGVPESSLGHVGTVRGQTVLEVGSGTAQVSAWLARAGARVVALDLSPDQLRTAARCQRAHGPTFPLVEADAEVLPLGDACVDLVVSEHGVGAWCDPRRWLPEAARVLRPGGRVVWLTNSALSSLCVPDDPGVATTQLQRPQRRPSRVEWDGGGVEHHPTHGEWITAIRDAGLVVDALAELYPPEGSEDHAWYEIVSPWWAERWPAEELWVAHRPTAG